MNRLRSGGRHFVLHRHEFVFLGSWSVTASLSPLFLFLFLSLVSALHSTQPRALSLSLFPSFHFPYTHTDRPIHPSFSFGKGHVKIHRPLFLSLSLASPSSSFPHFVSKPTRHFEYKKNLTPFRSIRHRFDISSSHTRTFGRIKSRNWIGRRFLCSVIKGNKRVLHVLIGKGGYRGKVIGLSSEIPVKPDGVFFSGALDFCINLFGNCFQN